MIFVTNFLSLSPILDLCTLLTFPTFYLLVLDSFLRCNNPNNFCTTVTLIPHTYCATHSVFPLALPNFLVSTTITQRGHYCFLKICLFFFFSPPITLWVIFWKVKWNEIFVSTFPSPVALGQGWIKRIYIKIKSIWEVVRILVLLWAKLGSDSLSASETVTFQSINGSRRSASLLLVSLLILQVCWPANYIWFLPRESWRKFWKLPCWLIILMEGICKLYWIPLY